MPYFELDTFEYVIMSRFYNRENFRILGVSLMVLSTENIYGFRMVL